MKTRTVTVAAILLGWMLVFSAVALRAAEGPSAEAIEKASTATDHAALADRYTKEATELSKKVEEHTMMFRTYKKGPTYHKVRRRASSAAMVRHCKKLIDHYTWATTEAEAMAREHRELAGGSS